MSAQLLAVHFIQSQRLVNYRHLYTNIMFLFFIYLFYMHMCKEKTEKRILNIVGITWRQFMLCLATRETKAFLDTRALRKKKEGLSGRK